MTPDPADKSLLRCTLKKSADVFAKLVLYASCAVCGATALALAVYGVFALCLTLAEPVRAIVDAVWNWTLPSQMFAEVTGVLAAIPWYAYVGIAAVAAIPVYSLLWCIAREFTEEDWDMTEPYKREQTWYELLLKILLIPIALIEWLLTANAGKITATRRMVFFFGAYLHYRKRVKEERK